MKIKGDIVFTVMDHQSQARLKSLKVNNLLYRTELEQTSATEITLKNTTVY